MLAAAAGRSSNDTNWSRHPGPSWSASTPWTTLTGSGGAASCRRTSAARYGPASSTGITASMADRACPIFMAPPLSSPRVWNSWAAVRAWTSAATSSAGRPPIRLPSPIATRPAWAAGNPASRAERRRAFLGMSGIGPSWPNVGPGEVRRRSNYTL